jgi:hypothetical protein
MALEAGASQSNLGEKLLGCDFDQAHLNFFERVTSCSLKLKQN